MSRRAKIFIYGIINTADNKNCGVCMIIKKMHINKFRDMENLDIDFGGKITFIAGGNGTYKTSLLGLIGNTFTYRDKETRKPIAKTIMDDEFRAWLGDIHHFT